MQEQVIDLRSDALTPPTDRALASLGHWAGDDSQAQELERRTATMFGKEAALFVPSATMANLIACLHHGTPGDQVLVDEDAHLYRNEVGGMSRVAGLLPRVLPRTGAVPCVDSARNALDALRGGGESPISLLWLELTHNVGGGAVADLHTLATIHQLTRDHGVTVHVDGARIFNAALALDVPVATLAQYVDSISVGFNKAVGSPMGCVLVGSRELINTAVPLRRMLGGYLYKPGILAGACLAALDTSWERLARDHETAAMLGEVIEDIPGLALETPVATNIVRFDTGAVEPATGFVQRLARHGVLMGAVEHTVIRAVTHHRIFPEHIQKVREALAKCVDEAAPQQL